MSDLCITNLRLNNKKVSLHIKDGRISEIADASQPTATAKIIDGQDAIVIPSFVDCHMHLDKTLIGGAWQSNQAENNLASRIATERRMRKELNHDPAHHGLALMKKISAYGTTALRSHVDIDHEIGVYHLERLFTLKDQYKEYMDMEFIAFPQSGILKSPGTEEYLEEALKMGCDGIGGLDPCLFDGNPAKHLDILFSLADKYQKKIYIHLHEPSDIGAFSIELIAERTKVLGMQGKVSISHAFALGMVPEGKFKQLAKMLQEQQITIITSAPGSAVLPPLKALVDEGVSVAAGSDNIRDFWSPYGSGDMLERAMFIGYRSNYRRDEEIEFGLSLCAGAGRTLLELPTNNLTAGDPADFILIQSPNLPQAVLEHPERLMVFKSGKLIAENGQALW